MKKYLYIFGFLSVVCMLFLATEDRRIAGSILNVSLPFSASSIECESWGFTDTLTTCVFDVNPDDFDGLLNGWEFEKREVSGNSHEMGGGPKLGKNFNVSTLYIVHPAEFIHGGHVVIVTNRERSKVSTDIYIE